MPNMTSRKRAWLVYAITKDGSGDIEQKEVGHLYVVCGEEVEDYGLSGSRGPKLFLELLDYDCNETKPWVIANSYLRDNNRFCWYFIPGIYRDDYAFTGTHRGHSEDVTPYDVDLNVRPVPENGDCQGTRSASHPSTEWPLQPTVVAENNDETQEVTTHGLGTVTSLVLTPGLRVTGYDASTSNGGTGHKNSLFTVKVYFSEAIDTGYLYFANSVAVTGGTVSGRASQVEHQSDKWKFSVRPEGDDPVTLSIAVPSACEMDSDGKQMNICTANGDMLGGAWTATIPW